MYWIWNPFHISDDVKRKIEFEAKWLTYSFECALSLQHFLIVWKLGFNILTFSISKSCFCFFPRNRWTLYVSKNLLRPFGHCLFCNRIRNYLKAYTIIYRKPRVHDTSLWKMIVSMWWLVLHEPCFIAC